MLYIYGDSHANYNFKNILVPNVNFFQSSVTMHRIGRDKQIIKYNSEHNDYNNIFLLCYGEVDCRCHIGKQLLLGRELDDICKELVNEYIDTIKKTITKYKKIIVCSITPTSKKNLYESVRGPITHEFPFVGNDNQRVIYTKQMNKLLKEHCKINDYIFLDVYDYYAEEDGTLKYDLSDKCVHISDNNYINNKLKEIISTLD
jgi:hypothetical protein